MTISGKLFIVFLMIINFIFSLAPSCHSSSNLALGKHYTFSQLPNYPLSAPSSDTSALTDGKYTIGHFWTQKSTVGWRGTKTIEILIDLEKESNVGSITFNSARGEKEGGVYYPAHIGAFVGTDKEHLIYVGDLALTSGNQPGNYQIKRFLLNNVGKRARYVFLEIVPKGMFIFCDEIEVLEGSSGSYEKSGKLSIPQARIFTDKVRLTGVGDILNNQQVNPSNNKTAAGWLDYIKTVENQILSSEISNYTTAVEVKMLGLRSAVLKPFFPNRELIIQTVKPWDYLIPATNYTETEPNDLSLLLPKGGYGYKALSVTNVSLKPMLISVSLGKASAGVKLTTYHVPFVKTATMEYIADPLVPALKNFTLRAGESQVIFVAARGTIAGTWNNTLQIKSDGRFSSIPITIQVTNIELPTKQSLNSVNWGYLDFKLIRGRQQAAVADMLVHHTNVIVVPPAYLPITDSIKAQDFSGLEKYLNTSKGVSKVLLFASLGSPQRSSVNGKYPFMGDDWKIWFKTWYEGLTKTVVNSGISKNNMYFYPYDEMDEKLVDDFIVFADWARKELPEIRLYATIDKKKALKTVPYLDVAQIANQDELIRQIGATSAELWLYDARGPAKSLSPYSYYRLMAWKAFFENYNGIGFWAYADAGWGDNSGTAWDDFDGKNPDFAVIYEGENNTIVSSRRWEAWRMGIEDYELLTMYARKKGESAAKALAKEVLDNPDDTTRADLVRRQTLEELSR